MLGLIMATRLSQAWTPVSIAKLGAWYLLMIVSFVLVTLVHRPRQLDRVSPRLAKGSFSRRGR